MKFVIALSFLLALAAAEFYSNVNDKFDVDALAKNPEKLKTFVGCFLDTAPCTDVPPAYIGDIPDAVRTACARCSPIQKVQLLKFLNHAQAQLPEETEAFNKKYDPEGKYMPALIAVLTA